MQDKSDFNLISGAQKFYFIQDKVDKVFSAVDGNERFLETSGSSIDVKKDMDGRTPFLRQRENMRDFYLDIYLKEDNQPYSQGDAEGTNLRFLWGLNPFLTENEQFEDYYSNYVNERLAYIDEEGHTAGLSIVYRKDTPEKWAIICVKDTQLKKDQRECYILTSVKPSFKSNSVINEIEMDKPEVDALKDFAKEKSIASLLDVVVTKEGTINPNISLLIHLFSDSSKAANRFDAGDDWMQFLIENTKSLMDNGILKAMYHSEIRPNLMQIKKCLDDSSELVQVLRTFVNMEDKLKLLKKSLFKVVIYYDTQNTLDFFEKLNEQIKGSLGMGSSRYTAAMRTMALMIENTGRVDEAKITQLIEMLHQYPAFERADPSHLAHYLESKTDGIISEEVIHQFEKLDDLEIKNKVLYKQVLSGGGINWDTLAPLVFDNKISDETLFKLLNISHKMQVPVHELIHIKEQCSKFKQNFDLTDREQYETYSQSLRSLYEEIYNAWGTPELSAVNARAKEQFKALEQLNSLIPIKPQMYQLGLNSNDYKSFLKMIDVQTNPRVIELSKNEHQKVDITNFFNKTRAINPEIRDRIFQTLCECQDETHDLFGFFQKYSDENLAAKEFVHALIQIETTCRNVKVHLEKEDPHHSKTQNFIAEEDQYRKFLYLAVYDAFYHSTPEKQQAFHQSITTASAKMLQVINEKRHPWLRNTLLVLVNALSMLCTACIPNLVNFRNNHQFFFFADSNKSKSKLEKLHKNLEIKLNTVNTVKDERENHDDKGSVKDVPK